MPRSAPEVVGDMMRTTAALRRLARRRVAAGTGVTPLPEAQRELLFVVKARPGIGVAAAAAELDLAGNSVSTLVNALVDAGLLQRETDPDDRRAARLTLTEAAEKRIHAYRAARDRLLGDALDKAGPEDRQAIEAALPALQRLLAELRGNANEKGEDVTDIAEPSAVDCRGLRYQFGETVAVDGIDLTVHSGEIFGLLGPNGAGKTTTIRAIIALLPVPAGVISVFGRDVASRRMAVRRMIGYVPQQLSADGGLTGEENVALFARLFDVPRRHRRHQVANALEMMGLADVSGRQVKTYSGGMIRRLELAQALVSAPRLLILDEPTIGLDPVARAGVWDHIATVRAETGMTVLVTTHYMDEAEQSCDRVALMHRGRIRAIGTPTELIAGLDRPEATLDDVFRAYSGDIDGLGDEAQGGIRNVRATRRTAGRVG